jgi:site-specific DNA recombinase
MGYNRAMTSTNAKKRAARYRRISADPEGRELGVDRQAEDLDRLGERENLEWVAGADFVDNDLSASTLSRDVRPDYDRLLAGARAGDYEVIAAVTQGRLTRRPREFEDLIALATGYGITFVYDKSPRFDLNTADGRAAARTVAAWDAAEAERIAERVKRAARQRAEKGLWHGGRTPPPGYELVRDDGGRVTALRLDPDQAALLRDGARRLLAGESLYAVCNDWNSRGLTTREGAHWRSATLRRALLSPSMIGKRAANLRAWRRGDKLYDATIPWPELLDGDTWSRLHDLLSDPARRFPPLDGSYGGKRALGGGVTICGNVVDEPTGRACGKKLVSQRHRGKVRLICHKQATGGCGVVTISYEPLEEFVLDMLLTRLDSPEFRAQLRRERTDTTGQERALRDELADLDLRRRRVGDAVVVGAYTRADAEAKVREIDDRERRVRDTLTNLTADRVTADVHSSEDARRLWDESDVSRRRRFARSYVSAVVVAPWPAGQASTLTRRRGESDEELETRRRDNLRAALMRRVDIRWRR